MNWIPYTGDTGLLNQTECVVHCDFGFEIATWFAHEKVFKYYYDGDYYPFFHVTHYIPLTKP